MYPRPLNALVLSLLASLPAALLAVLLIGCEDDEPPPGPPPPTQAAPATQPAREPVTLIEIAEHNRDSFAEPLLLSEYQDDDPAFAVLDGRVAFDRTLAEETDPARLAARGVMLGDSKVPLARCKVLVAHVIVYAGKGRAGAETRCYGFADFPVNVRLPAPPTGDRFEHDPADQAQPFLTAINGVRIFPAGADRLVVRGAEQGEGIEVVLGQAVEALPAGGSVELPQTSRTLQVVEGALTLDAVELENPPPGELPAVIEPGRDYGQVTFTTKLSVRHRGSLAVSDVPLEPADGEAGPDGEQIEEGLP